MSMIGIAASTYDPFGAVRLDGILEGLDRLERRYSLVATLDTGASVYDTGVSPADTRFSVTVRPASPDLIATVRWLVENYAQPIISTRLGCYRGVVGYKYTNGQLRLTIQLVSKISE